jgi:WD40 repeat protein
MAIPSPPLTAGHEGPVTVVAMSPDGHHALSGSDDRTLKLWDLPTGRLVHVFAGHENAVIAATIAAGGLRALSGSYDCILRLWDLRTGELLRTFAGREWVSSVTVPSSCLHQILELCSLGDSREMQTTRRMLRLAAFRTLQRWIIQLSYSGSINAVATTANGRCALAASHDGILTLWDFRTGRLIRTFAGHEGPIHAVDLAPDDRHALSGSADRTLRLWDVGTGRLLHSFAGHTGPVISVAVCPDGRHGLSGSRDRTLRLWDLEERSCLAIAPLESAPQAITLAPDGRAIVVGDRVGNIHHFGIHLN